MKLNYKPIKEQVWHSVSKPVKKYVNLSSIIDSVGRSILSPIQNSINQTLREHNEIKL